MIAFKKKQKERKTRVRISTNSHGRKRKKKKRCPTYVRVDKEQKRTTYAFSTRRKDVHIYNKEKEGKKESTN